MDLLLTIAIGYIGLLSERVEDKRVSMELIHISKRIYGIPRFKFMRSQMEYMKYLLNARKELHIYSESHFGMVSYRYSKHLLLVSLNLMVIITLPD